MVTVIKASVLIRVSAKWQVFVDSAVPDDYKRTSFLSEGIFGAFLNDVPSFIPKSTF